MILQTKKKYTTEPANEVYASRMCTILYANSTVFFYFFDEKKVHSIVFIERFFLLSHCIVFI